MDSLGVSRIPFRLFGTVDYKRARYVFMPTYAIRQALLVDSKAEKDGSSATLQRSQTSMRMRHTLQGGGEVDEQGGLPTVIDSPFGGMLTTTTVVKFVYDETDGQRSLLQVIIAAVPSGMLQNVYNPNAQQTIWRRGRNAPTLDEEFRVRLSYDRLATAAAWRVQRIQLLPAPTPFVWNG